MPPFIISLILLAVSMLLTMLLVKPNKVKPAALEDFDFPIAEDGEPEAVLFGDGWLTGPMVCWFGNYRTIKIKSKGKK